MKVYNMNNQKSIPTQFFRPSTRSLNNYPSFQQTQNYQSYNNNSFPADNENYQLYPQQIGIQTGNTNKRYKPSYGDVKSISIQLFYLAEDLFHKHDKNRSGYLDSIEMYACVSELYHIHKIPPPDHQTVLRLMHAFDANLDGLIDLEELKQMLNTLLSL